jgi:hypothetical protein
VLILQKGAVPSSSDASSLPASLAPVGIEILETGRIALNNCFAVPSAGRPTAAACAGIASNTYLNDGRNGSMEFDGLTTDAGNDGMQFRKPEILRQISDAPGAEKILVRLSALRKDGLNRELITVAGNSSAGWQLIGNNRQYESNVNAVASKRISANTPANNRYETGLNLYVRDDNTITNVVVTGPGLPSAGITLVPRAACGGYLTISDGSPAPSTATCATYYRLRSQKTDGTAFTPTSSTHLYSTTATESTISAIRPLDLYKFVLTKSAGGTITYWNRLRSRPYTSAEIASVKFSDFTPATVALMAAGSTFYTGGAAPTVSWTTPEFGPRPGHAAFIHDTGSDDQRFALGTTSTVIKCSSNPGCSNSSAGPDYVSPVANASTYVFQTYARNRFDTLIYSGVAK